MLSKKSDKKKTKTKPRKILQLKKKINFEIKETEGKEVVPIPKRQYSLSVILTVQSLQISVYMYKT